METVANIGTLNEGGLHNAVKEHYARFGIATEQTVDGFVVDVVADDCLYEIQTSGFGSIRRKLETLLLDHRVILVYPLATTKYIRKDVGDGSISVRKSPKRETVVDVFRELVYIPRLLEHPNLELELAYCEVIEDRTFNPRKAWRRHGWAVTGRNLSRLDDTRRFTSMKDLFEACSCGLAHVFTTAELAQTLKVSRALAQKAAYCFRECGVLEVCGKRGNAIQYRKATS